MPRRDDDRDRNDLPITAHSLRMHAARRADTNHDSYRMIYSRVRRALGEHVRAHPKVYFLAWKVPTYLYGRPLYNHAHAVRYVSEKLMHGGFKVSLAPGSSDLLVIDWTPAPIPRVPASIRAEKLVRRREVELAREAKRRHASRRRAKKEERLGRVVQGTAHAREAAENLNAHLEGLLRSMEQ